MYCGECGYAATTTFCPQCGAALQRRVDAAADWRTEARYRVLLHFPEVRERIAKAAGEAKTCLSGEDFLKLADHAFKPLTGVSLSLVHQIAAPLSAKLGIQTGKKQTAALSQPIGGVLVAAVCSLAQRGRQLDQVHQGEDGCVLEATIASDWRSFAGKLIVSIQRQGETATSVAAQAQIPGQLFDWGKSAQCLDQFFSDVRALAN